jgi:hypothetical protein
MIPMNHAVIKDGDIIFIYHRLEAWASLKTWLMASG